MPTKNIFEQTFETSDGKKISVQKATYLMGLDRGNRIGDFIANPHDSPLVQAGRVNLYASLAACSTGDVPSADEFTNMLEDDVEEWIRIAKEKNPRWFAWLDKAIEAVEAALTPAEQKKKESRKRHKS